MIALLWSLALLVVPLAGAVRARALLRSRVALPGGPGRVLLVRPVAGDEPGLAERLASAARARMSFPLEVIIAVESAADPGHVAAGRAARALDAAGVAARVVRTGGGGLNHKVAQLEAAVRAAPTVDTVVVADSDVDLTGVDLDALVGALALADAAWAPPVEVAPRTAGDRASGALLSASLHAFPLLCGLDPTGLVGKLFAVRRRALDAVGGFDALRDRLGEDVELSRRLGGRVRPAPLVARSHASGRTMNGAVDRYARWLVVVRAQRPHLLAAYPLLFLGTWPVLALSLAGGAPSSAVAAAIALAARLVTVPVARRLSGLPAGGPVAWLGLAVRGDLLLARALLRSARSRRLLWRGRELTVGPDGRLHEHVVRGRG